MKTKFCRITAAFIALFTIVTLLASCTGPAPATGSATVVIADTDAPRVFSVQLDELRGGSVYDALLWLRDEGLIDFTSVDGPYGAYLTEIGRLKPDSSAGKYVGVWTSREAEWDVSSYATELEYNGVKLTSSGFGISSMQLSDGVIVYIGEGSY